MFPYKIKDSRYGSLRVNTLTVPYQKFATSVNFNESVDIKLPHKDEWKFKTNTASLLFGKSVRTTLLEQLTQCRLDRFIRTLTVSAPNPAELPDGVTEQVQVVPLGPVNIS